MSVLPAPLQTVGGIITSEAKRQIYKGQAMQRQLQKWIQTPSFVSSPSHSQAVKHKHIYSAKPVVFLPVTLLLYTRL